MKKVALVTFYSSNNYGTCLQAYALQKTILSMNNECKIIKKVHKSSTNSNITILDKIKYIIKLYGIRNVFSYLKSSPIRKKKIEDFSKFRKQYLKFDNNDCSELKDIADLYDKFVCGSDMMWSKEFIHLIDFYALKDIDGSKKIAYAPSFGEKDLPADLENIYIKVLSDFDNISSREKSGVEIIEKLLGKKAFHAVDPTMLISKEQWVEQFDLKKTNEEKYILVYVFKKKDSEFKKYVSDISKKSGYKIKYIPMEFYDFKNTITNDYGPKGFLDSYYNADFVVTDGFHGLIFSLIFNKPFVLIHRDRNEHWGKYEDRMSCILDNVGLSDRYIYTDDNFDKDMLRLNYEEVNRKIEKQRQESLQYLMESLNRD